MLEPATFQGREEHATLVRGNGHLLAALPTQNGHFFFENNRDKQGRDLTVMRIARDDWSQPCGPRSTRSGIFHFPSPGATKGTLLQSLWEKCVLTHSKLALHTLQASLHPRHDLH